MSTGADAARLTIQLREPSAQGYDVTAAEIVRRAHAAGMWSATILRGRARPALSGGAEMIGTVPAARTSTEEPPVVQRLSLSDEEGFSIAIAGREEEFAPFVRQLHDLIGDAAIVLIESRGQVHELPVPDKPVLTH